MAEFRHSQHIVFESESTKVQKFYTLISPHESTSTERLPTGFRGNDAGVLWSGETTSSQTGDYPVAGRSGALFREAPENGANEGAKRAEEKHKNKAGEIDENMSRREGNLDDSGDRRNNRNPGSDVQRITA
jgi:hypothetical protein